jgi:hypothetical protein
VPQRYVPRYVQQACSLTHKVLLAMVLFRYLEWWRIIISSGVRLDGVRSLRWLRETLGIILYFSIS